MCRGAPDVKHNDHRYVFADPAINLEEDLLAGADQQLSVTPPPATYELSCPSDAH
jgi:hypothetical protein